MRCKRQWLALVVGVILGSCSSDDGKQTDPIVISLTDTAADARLTDAGSRPDAANAFDAADPSDLDNTADAIDALADASIAPEPNSGALCGPQQPCAAGGDRCIFLGSLSDGGICLGECGTAGESCPVPGPSMRSVCTPVRTTNSDLNLCLWYCELNGASYSCPNDDDYICEPYDDNDPSSAVCKPAG